MNSCAAFFCTCCLGDLCGSGISDSLPTGAARPCCHSASNCLPQQASRRTPADQNRNAIQCRRFGCAQNAAVRWFCWSGSAPFRHDSVLLLCNQKLAHDSIFLISNRRHAPAPKPDVCSPTAPGAGWDAELPPTWRPSPQPHPENRSARLFPLSVDRTCQHPKSIAPKFQTASFKSLYQKRSGERDPCVSPKLIAPERFRYSTKTFGQVGPER
jgi:hypothetical protein